MTKKRKATKGREADAPAPVQAIEPAAPPYERTPEEAAAFDRLYERREGRLRPPQFTVETQAENKVQISAGHPDRKVWTVSMMETFGVTEGTLASHLMAQLIAATAKNGAVETEHVNANIAAVHGIGPRDAVEGMLAAQMVATHHAAMDMLERAGKYPGTGWAETYTNSATKMLRTFTTQVEALKRYRAKGEQRYVVQHVHVTADQAAVQVNGNGPVPPPVGGEVGGTINSGDQPHAVSNQPPHLPSLLCPDAQGDALPVPSGQG